MLICDEHRNVSTSHLMDPVTADKIGMDKSTSLLNLDGKHLFYYGLLFT